jgi:hypothetical protein
VGRFKAPNHEAALRKIYAQVKFIGLRFSVEFIAQVGSAEWELCYATMDPNSGDTIPTAGTGTMMTAPGVDDKNLVKAAATVNGIYLSQSLTKNYVLGLPSDTAQLWGFVESSKILKDITDTAHVAKVTGHYVFRCSGQAVMTSP